MPIHSRTLSQHNARCRTDGDSIVRACSDDADWLVRGDLRPDVLGDDAPNWFALTAGSSAECVKVGHRRAVWRVRAGGRALFAKIVEPGGWRAGLKRRLVGTSAEREWRVLCEAESRGVPVAAPVAVGVSRAKAGCAVLLTEAFEDAESLSDVWQTRVEAHGTRDRLAAACPLLDGVARAIALAHDAGFEHRDGHPHNFLARRDEARSYEVRYVDVLGGAFRSHLSAVAVARNLAQLDHFFRGRVTATERLRFLRAYLGHREADRSPVAAAAHERRVVADVAVARAAQAEMLASHRDRRLRSDGKYFSRIRLDQHWRGTVCLALERRHRFPESEVPDRTLADWHELLDAVAGPANVGGVPAHFAASSGLMLVPSDKYVAMACLRNALAGSAHRRSFEICHRNRHRDLPSDLVLGYLERRCCGLVDRSLLILPSPSRGIGCAGTPAEVENQ